MRQKTSKATIFHVKSAAILSMRLCSAVEQLAFIEKKQGKFQITQFQKKKKSKKFQKNEHSRGMFFGALSPNLGSV